MLCPQELRAPSSHCPPWGSPSPWPSTAASMAVPRQRQGDGEDEEQGRLICWLLRTVFRGRRRLLLPAPHGPELRNHTSGTETGKRGLPSSHVPEGQRVPWGVSGGHSPWGTREPSRRSQRLGLDGSDAQVHAVLSARGTIAEISAFHSCKHHLQRARNKQKRTVNKH